MDRAWTLDSAFTGGLPTTQWSHDSGTIKHTGTFSRASSAILRTTPYGDVWWAYTPPPRPDRGTFDVYVSALDNGTPVYSNPQPLTYTYDPEIITQKPRWRRQSQ